MDRFEFDGSLATLDRTQEWCNKLTLCWLGFLHTDPYRSRIVRDADGVWHRIELDFSRPVPLEIVIKLGQITRVLGAVLDDAVRAAAVEFLGRELTPDERGVIVYPLRWGSDELERASVRRFVSDAAWAIIARHQPSSAARSLGLLHWRSGLEKAGRIHPAVPPYFENFRPFYTHSAHTEPTEVIYDLDPWSPLEGWKELVRMRFPRNGHDPQLRVQRTPLLHVSCGPLPQGVQYTGTTEMIKDVRRVITDFAELRTGG